MLLNCVTVTEEKEKQTRSAIECVSLGQMREELLAMLKVCFEGEARAEDEKLFISLPNGERFALSVEKY